eukprot:SAG22_NODE_2800_length_2200_cov_1.099000_2_plen_87_part_00
MGQRGPRYHQLPVAEVNNDEPLPEVLLPSVRAGRRHDVDARDHLAPPPPGSEPEPGTETETETETEPETEPEPEPEPEAVEAADDE